MKAPDNAVTRALHPQKKSAHKHNVWIEGRFIWYAPTRFPAHEVAEWGGRYDKKKQAYRLPKLTRLVRRIAEYDPDATMTADVKRIGKGEWEKTDQQVAQATLPDYGKYESLYPYQVCAAEALATRPYHGEMLALSPGLGKTPTSIVAGDLFMQVHGESQRALVVAPLSLLDNWVEEIERWSDDPRVERCHGTAPTDDRSVRWTVTNYETLMERVKDQTSGRWSASGNLNEDWDLDWDVVIYDESVLLKNRKAKRTTVARVLAHRAKRVWLLSGAPITRDNSDIWAQFNIMEPDYFTAFWRFAQEFCVVVKTQWSQGEIQGSRRDMHVRKEFPELMFVRNQEEVFEDLPTSIHKDVPLRLTKRQRKAHDDILTTWLHELDINRDKRVEVTAVIAMLTRLQQVTSNLYNLETTGHVWPDESCKADFVQETLDLGEVEWPVLIWTHHRPGAKALKNRLDKLTKRKDSAMYKRRVELVYGGTKGIHQIVKDFQAGKVDVLIFGIAVGKYGHTLARAHTVITYDKTWDSDAWFQMLHRVGGARAKLAGFQHTPIVLNPRCIDTVDTFVELNLAGKLPAMANLTGADLGKILRSLGEEHVANLS